MTVRSRFRPRVQLNFAHIAVEYNRRWAIDASGYLNSALLVVLLALVLSPTAARADVSARVSRSTEAVQQYLKMEMASRHIPGMQVAVIQHGRIVFSTAMGVANINRHIPVTDTTMFAIASATKAFTGVALLQLVERHKLDLAAPVSRYLDRLPRAWGNVTIRQLAAEISGLPSLVDNDTGKLIVDGDIEASWARVQSLPLEFAPGTGYSYNQTNYVLLGKVIDKLAGEPFTKFVEREQFEIVGMPHTRYGNDHDLIPTVATTYSSMINGNGKLGRTASLHSIFLDYPQMLRTAAGIESTADDIAHWIMALQDGRLLKNKRSLTTMWTPVRPTTGESGPWAWSIGWPVLSRPKHPEYGASGAEKAAFAVYPNDDLSVVILTNLQGASPEQFLDKVAAFFIPDLIVSGGR
jgi:CubicO group peptidase (beta-lactamase class C family)